MPAVASARRAAARLVTIVRALRPSPFSRTAHSVRPRMKASKSASDATGCGSTSMEGSSRRYGSSAAAQPALTETRSFARGARAPAASASASVSVASSGGAPAPPAAGASATAPGGASRRRSLAAAASTSAATDALAGTATST